MKLGDRFLSSLFASRLVGFLFVSLFLSAALLAGAADVEDVRWREAEQAYQVGDDANGHKLMKAILDDNPGDPEVATKCLETILVKAGRRGGDNAWVRFAVRRLVALERLGGVSANTKLARDVFDSDLEYRRREGRFLELVEERDRMAEENRRQFSVG